MAQPWVHSPASQGPLSIVWEGPQLLKEIIFKSHCFSNSLWSYYLSTLSINYFNMTYMFYVRKMIWPINIVSLGV